MAHGITDSGDRFVNFLMQSLPGSFRETSHNSKSGDLELLPEDILIEVKATDPDTKLANFNQVRPFKCIHLIGEPTQVIKAAFLPLNMVFYYSPIEIIRRAMPLSGQHTDDPLRCFNLKPGKKDLQFLVEVKDLPRKIREGEDAFRGTAGEPYRQLIEDLNLLYERIRIRREQALGVV